MPVDLKKLKKIAEEDKKTVYKGPLYLTEDAEDVIFNMGGKMAGWKGTKTSVMATDHDGRQILRWLVKKDFNEDCVEIIQYQLDEAY